VDYPKFLLKFCFQSLIWISVLFFFLWAAGAIYYLPWLPDWMRLPCCVAYVGGFSFWIWKSNRRNTTRSILAGSILAVYLLTLLIRPSNDRNWADDQARVASVEINDGAVTINNFRNFHYRTATDFDPIFETRKFPLKDLDSVSLILQNFTPSEGLAHVMLSFGVGSEAMDRELPQQQREYFCLSVEVRREKGETYGPLKGVYRNYELTHVIGDERDLIGVRTVHRSDDRVWLYRLNATPQQVQQLFIRFTDRINGLESAPEFYHTLLNNCANGITRQTYELTAEPINWLDPRIVLPGFSDQFAFENGLIENPQNETFEQLKLSSRIDLRARVSGITRDFSADIRQQ